MRCNLVLIRGVELYVLINNNLKKLQAPKMKIKSLEQPTKNTKKINLLR